MSNTTKQGNLPPNSTGLVQHSYPPLQNKKQAAEFYGVSERTIDRWLAEGTLPASAKVTIGGCVRFRTAALMAHINGSDGGEA